MILQVVEQCVQRLPGRGRELSNAEIGERSNPTLSRREILLPWASEEEVKVYLLNFHDIFTRVSSDKKRWKVILWFRMNSTNVRGMRIAYKAWDTPGFRKSTGKGERANKEGKSYFISRFERVLTIPPITVQVLGLEGRCWKKILPSCI